MDSRFFFISCNVLQDFILKVMFIAVGKIEHSLGGQLKQLGQCLVHHLLLYSDNLYIYIYIYIVMYIAL